MYDGMTLLQVRMDAALSFKVNRDGEFGGVCTYFDTTFNSAPPHAPGPWIRISSWCLWSTHTTFVHFWSVPESHIVSKQPLEPYQSTCASMVNRLGRAKFTTLTTVSVLQDTYGSRPYWCFVECLLPDCCSSVSSLNPLL